MAISQCGTRSSGLQLHKLPRSIEWASAFAGNAPQLQGRTPGPRSLALRERCLRGEFGSYPWVDQMPVAFETGQGVTLTDADDNLFIDLTHGHMGAALGHANPEIIEAVHRQFSRLSHVRNQPCEIRAQLQETLARITPGNLNLITFYSSGTEAAEGAMRVARAVTGGHEFVSFYGDYHGRTTGAIGTSVGSRMTGPRPSGFFSVPNGYCHRCEFAMEPSTCGIHCLDFAERAIRMNSHGALAGIVAEPITNASGARVFPDGYLRKLRDIADRTGALLIFDEHATGLGRTGRMWGGDHEGVIPDVIYFAKHLGNGYPVTAVAIREEYRDILASERQGERQGSTYGGQPLACAAALASVQILLRDNLTEHARVTGEKCLTYMKEVAERHAIVGIAQGRGLQLGYEFVDPKTRAPSYEIGHAVYQAAMERGIATSPVGPALRVSPMMVTSAEVALKALRILEEAIADVESRFA
jgi:4-aminobutyrate aminotransferase/4-aminobutyrate aminotransferase/(S)-3-amino-2-methylpropionate transaminase